MSSQSPLQPPSFSEFEYSFDTVATLSPPPLPIPSSADLFSPSETTDLLGFLDNFNWDFEADLAFAEVPHSPHISQGSAPLTAGNFRESALPLPDPPARSPAEQLDLHLDAPHARPSSSSSTTSSSPSKSNLRNAKRKRASGSSCATNRAKTLLSTPQKRLNHIMSEQKRRNAIRDGYAQLISLLAPAGQTIDMPTRGRPKGSGGSAKGHCKGKSGVLFRAVEYCRWLEEGRNALRDEVSRLEAAAGIIYPSR